jgi:hypothetical protein
MTQPPDLHTHSTASDGSLAPHTLLARAAAAGVRVLALTDHDTTAGLAEAAAAAAELGLTLVPGVEVSVTWCGGTVHIVGLGIDSACAELADGLAGLREQRQERAVEIARRLAAVGHDDALAGARGFAEGELIGRTHFARFLVARGAAADLRDVFKHYLVAGKPGYVRGGWTTLEQAVGWICRAGGQAVVAHPARYRLSRMKMRRLLGELRECGGIGVEVVSGCHSRDDCHVFAKHAREGGLLASAGSDYHGPEKPWIELGRLPPLPDGCAPIWALSALGIRRAVEADRTDARAAA